MATEIEQLESKVNKLEIAIRQVKSELRQLKRKTKTHASTTRPIKLPKQKPATFIGIAVGKISDGSLRHDEYIAKAIARKHRIR